MRRRPYCSAQEARVHFGLGDEKRCDVRVVLPFGKGEIIARDVAADQILILSEPIAAEKTP